MIVGLFCLVWSATSQLNSLGTWDDQNKVSDIMTNVLDMFVLIDHVGRGRVYCHCIDCHPHVLRRPNLPVLAHPRVECGFARMVLVMLSGKIAQPLWLVTMRS